MHHLVRSLCVAAVAGALTLQGCGKSPPLSSDRRPSDEPDAHATSTRALSPEDHAGSKALDGVLIANTAPAQYPIEDPPPWLAEMLHAPDPNVRIQGLDAWARYPGASLDPVTYALVDPDESVRTRAQQVLEQELARR
jgi:hypothetical protein